MRCTPFQQTHKFRTGDCDWADGWQRICCPMAVSAASLVAAASVPANARRLTFTIFSRQVSHAQTTGKPLDGAPAGGDSSGSATPFWEVRTRETSRSEKSASQSDSATFSRAEPSSAAHSSWWRSWATTRPTINNQQLSSLLSLSTPSSDDHRSENTTLYVAHGATWSTRKRVEKKSSKLVSDLCVFEPYSEQTYSKLPRTTPLCSISHFSAGVLTPRGTRERL